MPNELNNFTRPDSTGDNVYTGGGTNNFTGIVSFGSGATNTVSNLTFAISAGASNVCEVAISAVDASGNLIPAVQNLKVWLSDDATGIGQSGTDASGTVTFKTASGTVLDTLTAKQSLIVQTLATGVFTLEITDSAKTTFYVSVENPFTGKTVVSRILATGDYGA